jgi:hypothetical protein
MQIKQNNPLKTLKRSPASKSSHSRTRQLILICALIFGVGFYSGGYTSIPASVNSQLKEMSRLNSTVIKNYVRGKMSQPKKMTIDIKHKHYQYLEYKRAEALKRGVIITDEKSYVPAKVTVDGKTTKVRIRLKGDITDHLDGDKRSYRIKVKGKNAIWGMRRFSIQAPERSGWGHEWVMYKWFRKEGLISLRYDFIDLTINGKRLGIYALEESFGKELLENNQRREGPILKFDESLLFDKRKTSRGDKIKEIDLFYSADIISFTTTKLFADETLKNNFLSGRNMLAALRNGAVRFSDVFDVPRAAKTFAILEIINAFHAIRWKNCRFYYNPVTNKLELIAYNAYSRHPVIPLKKNSIPFYTAHHQKYLKGGLQEWRNLLLSDREFVRHYFAALDRFTSPGYLESFFSEISSDLKTKESYIFKDEPSRGINVPVYFHNRSIVRSFIYPKLPLKAYLKQYDGKKIRLSVNNPTFLPVVIDGIAVKKSGKFLGNPTPRELEGKNFGKPLEFIEVEVPAVDIGKPMLSSLRKGDAMVLGSLQIKYHIPGINEYRLAPIDAHSLSISPFLISSDESERQLREFTQKGMLIIDDQRKEVCFNPGKWTIEKNLVIPKGYKTKINSGCELVLNKGAAIISHGQIEMTGTKKTPVVLKSTDGTGQGLVVISADNPSKLSHVVFDNLRSVSRKNWNLTGAVTIYESKIEIDNVKFLNNHSEDHLNIIRSKFAIRNSEFKNSSGDALDVDFGEGTISDSSFESCGNDCLDFSGSRAEIYHTTIDGAGDKGMSVGEKSFVKVADSSVSHAVVALASKDMSKALAIKLQILDSKIGFAAYQKKPEFGGAQINATQTVMTNVENRHVGDGKSGIFENNGAVPLSHLKETM